MLMLLKVWSKQIGVDPFHFSGYVSAALQRAPSLVPAQGTGQHLLLAWPGTLFWFGSMPAQVMLISSVSGFLLPSAVFRFFSDQINSDGFHNCASATLMLENTEKLQHTSTWATSPPHTVHKPTLMSNFAICLFVFGCFCQFSPYPKPASVQKPNRFVVALDSFQVSSFRFATLSVRLPPSWNRVEVGGSNAW